MSIELTPARQVALRDRSSESVRFTETGIQTKSSRGPGWFRSAESTRQNKAAFAKFLEVLKADPNYRDVDGIADQAFAAIKQHASTGKPLTSRLMAQAYRAGDDALRKLQATRMEQRNSAMQGALGLVNTPRMLDHAVYLATEGKLDNLSSAVPPEVLTEIKADLVDSMRQEIDRQTKAGTVGQLRLTDLNKMLRASAAKHADRIQTLTAAGTSALVEIESLGSRRLQPVIDLVQDFSQQRLEARLLSSAGANEHFEQNVMREMGRRLAALDNSDLLAVYRTTLSSDMLELRLALANRPDDPRAQSLLQDLNSWEGMVNMEVAERSLAGLPDTGRKPQLSGAHLEMLASTERAAAKKELVQQSDDYLKGKPGAVRSEDPGAVRRLQGKSIGAPELTQLMRSSDLTVNLPSSLFDRGGPFIGQDGKVKSGGLQLKNIFELPSDVKGPEYLERRQIIEHAQVPGLKEREKSGVDPKLHPISAGLNVGRMVAGAAPRHGWAFLVLKDQVRSAPPSRRPIPSTPSNRRLARTTSRAARPASPSCWRTAPSCPRRGASRCAPIPISCPRSSNASTARSAARSGSGIRRPSRTSSTTSSPRTPARCLRRILSASATSCSTTSSIAVGKPIA